VEDRDQDGNSGSEKSHAERRTCGEIQKDELRLRQ
jgi:hypothetical protein